MKHVIENWIGPGEYVSNGACIKAAIELGFPVMQLTNGTGGSLNAQIGVKRNSVKQLCGIKKDNPNGKLVTMCEGRMSAITKNDMTDKKYVTLYLNMKKDQHEKLVKLAEKHDRSINAITKIVMG